MDIGSLPIISEVFGDSGSGRTSFCLCVAKYSNSLWIEASRKLSTKRAYSLRMDLEAIYIKRVCNIYSLIRSLAEGEIFDFIKDHKIDIVIINGIEDLEETEARSTKNYIEVVKQLKILYLILRVKSVIISSVSPNTQIHSEFSGCSVEEDREETESRRMSFLLKKYLRKPAPKSSISGEGWKYSMPTQLYIRKTNKPSIRIVEIVKPSVSNPPQYILEILRTEINIRRYEDVAEDK